MAEATTEEYRDDEIYKRWFRTKDRAGFLSISEWNERHRLSIDIGSREGDGDWSATKCWVDAYDFGAYVKAVSLGTAHRLFPASEKEGLPTPEAFVAYGGTRDPDSGPISRVFKSHYWSGKDNALSDQAFAFKCGHFKARESDTGAFIPDYNNPISLNMIKVSRQEMALIAYRIEMNNIAASVIAEFRKSNKSG